MILIVAVSVLVILCAMLAWRNVQGRKNFETQISILDNHLKDKDLKYKKLSETLVETKESINAVKRYSTGLENAVSEQKTSIADTLRYVYEIEKTLFPTRGMIKAVFPDFFIINTQDVSNGIFYKVFVQGNFSLLTCGCCGLSGISGRTKALLNIVFLMDIMQKINLETTSAGHIIDRLRTRYENLSDSRQYHGYEDLQVNFSACIINQKDRLLSFAGSFSNLCLVRKSYPGTSRKEVDVHEFRGEKMNFTQNYGRRKNFPSETFELEKDDKIYLKSENYANSKTRTNNRFNDLFFRQMLMKVGGLPMNEQQQIFCSELEKSGRINDVFIFGAALKIKYQQPTTPLPEIDDVDFV